MMTGVLTPDTGSVRIGGMDILKYPLEAKLKMGVIPENGTVYSDLRPNRISCGQPNFMAWTGPAVTPVRRDPGPSRPVPAERSRPFFLQRDAAADQHRMRHRAFPTVLFLDEPTTGLDVYSRRLVLDTVRYMNKEGSTVLITTHNIEEANELCSSISIIEPGKDHRHRQPRETQETVRHQEVCRDIIRSAVGRRYSGYGGFPGRAPGGQMAGVYGECRPCGETDCVHGRDG